MAQTAEKNGKADMHTEKKNIPFLEPAQFMKDMTEMSTKVMRGLQNLKEMSEDDLAVGATPRVKVLDVDGGKIKLYHYPNPKATCKVPLLLNFAVVNKEYILDLQEDKSFVRKMMEAGLEVYTIDWGYPTRADRYREVGDYVDYLDSCIDYIRKASGQKSINLLGICQGGTAALMYSALFPEKVRNLITVVMPFEFDLPQNLFFKWGKHVDPDPIADSVGTISGEAMNAGFLMVKPMQRLQKFHAFVNMMDNKDKVANFLRMERWLFDSPGQPGEAYREYTKRVFQGNELSQNKLTIDGRHVDLNNVTMPVLSIYAAQDHLVPPECAKPVYDKIPSKDKQIVEFPGGHVGVFMSGTSQKYVAPAISSWILERSKV